MAAAEKRSGSYSVRVSLTDPLTGKRTQKRVTAPTKRELDAKVSVLKASWNNGTYVEPAKQKLADYLSQWLGNLNRSGATKFQYATVANGHILTDRIASIPVGHLKRSHIQEFIDRKVANGCSPAYVHQMHSILSGALKRATKLGTIASNPAMGVDLPPLSRRKMTVWSGEETKAFLSGVANEPDLALWSLAVTIGLRRGELIGLKWEDIDLVRGTVSVRRTMTRDSAGHWIIGDVAKTDSSHRTIQVPTICHTALRNHRLQQLERRLHFGEAWQDTGAVFDLGNGTHIPSPGKLANRLARLVIGLELPQLTLHGLRHTAATNMLKGGVPVHVVAQILGHANPGVTLGVYAHVLADAQSEAAAKIDAMFA